MTTPRTSLPLCSVNFMPLAVDTRHDCDPSPLLTSDKALPTASKFTPQVMTSRVYNNPFASLLVTSFPISLSHQSIPSGFSIGELSPSIYKSNVATLVLNAALKPHEATMCKCIHISNRGWILNTISWLQWGWKSEEGDIMHFKHLYLVLISYINHRLLFH